MNVRVVADEKSKIEDGGGDTFGFTLFFCLKK